MNSFRKKRLPEYGLAERHIEKRWDILLKLVAVFMALLIWFWVTEIESHVTSRTFTRVEVHVENLPRGYNVIGDSEFHIDVTLQGRNADLNRLNSALIYAYVDLQDVERAGQVNLPVQIRQMSGAAVIEQSHSDVRLNIDRNIIRSVPVMGEIVKMARVTGVEVGELSFTPATVSVSGPEQIVNMIAYAWIYVDLGDGLIERSINVTRRFIWTDENGDEIRNPFISTSENSVEVFIPVYMTKDVPLRVNYRYGYYDENHVRVTINPERITLRGSPEYLNDLDEIVIGVINERRHDNNTTIRFPISLDGDVRNLSGVTVAEVEIVFTDMLTRTMLIPASQFRVTPPAGGLEYHIRDENLRVRLFGPSDRINRVTQSGVSVSVDLSGFTEPGIFPVPADAVVIAPGSPVFPIGDYSITVEITEIF